VDSITIPVGPRLGDLVLEAVALRKAFGERLLLEDASFRVPPGAVVGIIGGNGAGKSTLFRWARRWGWSGGGGGESPGRLHSVQAGCVAEGRRSCAPWRRVQAGSRRAGCWLRVGCLGAGALG
jgi:ABC-type nitrate/sulfonate/bicarbonate transport system ATPase subunit